MHRKAKKEGKTVTERVGEEQREWERNRERNGRVQETE